MTLDKHTQEVINDFMKIDPVMGAVIKLASEVSYLKGYKDAQDKAMTIEDIENCGINMAYEGVN